MSGGYWDYKDASLKEIIFSKGEVDEDGDYISVEDSNPLGMQVFSDFVADAFQMLHEYDWAASGDNDVRHFVDTSMDILQSWLKRLSELDLDAVREFAIKKLESSLYE